MPSVNIRGVSVDFPFEPYDLQTKYMEKVLECIQNETNGVLESPTGTGKTLSLLCSTLAWLQMKKAQVQAERHTLSLEENTNFLEGLTNKLDALVGKSGFGKALSGIPLIIYTSRTHSQLTQAMQELKRTSYRYMNSVIIGSRDQLCVNEEVMREQSNATKIHMCQFKVSSRTCYYFNGVERKKTDPAISEIPVMDIEDIVKLGKSCKFCPYYMTKELMKTADIIFMPYNYLLDFRIRRSLGIEFGGSVVIIDEAHNVEKFCEETASLQIKSSDIALVLDEITAVMKLVSEQVTTFEDTPKDFTADDLCELKEVFLAFEREIDNIDISLDSVTKEGTFIIDLLEKAGIRHTNSGSAAKLIHSVIQYLITVNDGPFARKGAGLQHFEDIFMILFGEKTETYLEKVKKCCKVHIEHEEVKKKRADNWLSKATTKAHGKILNYWCFSPGFSMNLLANLGLKSLILTSGTLAPLKPLISELDLKVGAHLENPHIVTGEQICVKILSQGPDREPLNCNYQNRSNPKYINSLGMSISNLVKVIPGGLLIFFPSYPILLKCQEVWQQSGLWSSINSQKTIYVEPRDKDSFNTAMLEYYKKINDPLLKGAIFMAVCRGKVSEGLDFADINGRAVIIVGLPYPPLKDPRIVLKKSYMDSRNREDKEYLRGDEWYSLEASRTVNQAIGRVIRHKNDYGAILLLDTRFNDNRIMNKMSMWLRKYVSQVKNFGELMRDLRRFFSSAEEKFPTKPSAPSQAVSAEFQKPKIYQNASFNFSTSSIQFSSSSSSETIKSGEVVIHNSKKRKLVVKPNSSSSTNMTRKTEVKEYIIMVKKNLPEPFFNQFLTAMESYKNTEDLEQLKSSLDTIFKDKYHLRYIVWGLENYVKEKHKQEFSDYCDKNR